MRTKEQKKKKRLEDTEVEQADLEEEQGEKGEKRKEKKKKKVMGVGVGRGGKTRPIRPTRTAPPRSGRFLCLFSRVRIGIPQTCSDRFGSHFT